MEIVWIVEKFLSVKTFLQSTQLIFNCINSWPHKDKDKEPIVQSSIFTKIKVQNLKLKYGICSHLFIVNDLKYHLKGLR